MVFLWFSYGNHLIYLSPYAEHRCHLPFGSFDPRRLGKAWRGCSDTWLGALTWTKNPWDPMGIPKKSKIWRRWWFDHFTSKNWDFDQEKLLIWPPKIMVIGPKWWFDQRKIVLWTNQDSKTWITSHFLVSNDCLVPKWRHLICVCMQVALNF